MPRHYHQFWLVKILLLLLLQDVATASSTFMGMVGTIGTQ
jgi:hypothetical protein